jgi:hypothetical protein
MSYKVSRGEELHIWRPKKSSLKIPIYVPNSSSTLDQNVISINAGLSATQNLKRWNYLPVLQKHDMINVAYTL